MADQMTTTQTKAEKEKAAAQEKVAKALESLRQALVDAGEDPGQVDAKLYAVRQPETNVVGNLADLQRMGAAAYEGEDSSMKKSVEENMPPPAQEV